MLTIVVPARQLYDEENEEFLDDETAPAVTLKLEHSLISLSKWESRFEKPFLDTSQIMTPEEKLGYIQCMDLARNTPIEVYARMSTENIADIDAYINAKMSATWFSDATRIPKSKEIITSEVIYYWMFSYGISLECEKWHLSRLFTLIRVCSIKVSPPEKMSRSETIERQKALNDQRRKKHGTKG